MNELNLYSLIEQDLDFAEEITKLYDAYELLIKQIEPSSLLDIGCGQGEFLLQIQDKNINTFGIDLSDEQIKICQEKNLSTACLNICELNDKYDVLTAVFDVLNYIDAKDINSFLQCSYDTLNNDGYLIFDINSLFGFEEVAQGSLNISKKNKFIAIDAYFENKQLSTTITLFEKQKNDTYTKNENTIKQYFHENSFLEKNLVEIGFKIENIINFNLHDTSEADKYIFICKK